MAVTPLLAWVDEPNAGKGIRFARDRGWDWWPYTSLAEFAWRVADGLIAAGIEHDDCVLVVHPSGPEFVATLFGTMLAGATPCPVAPPAVFQDRKQYAAHIRGSAGAARPAAVVTTAGLLDRVTGLLAGDRGPPVVTLDDVTSDVGRSGHRPRRPPAHCALLQLTSGSSGRPRGVRIPFDALAANVSAIRQWLAMTEDDPTASWLPVHHDMGLIGCLLTPVANQSDLWLMEPERFVRDPMRYLRCFDTPGARLTAMPTFGLAHVTRRVTSDALAGIDLSDWRAVIVGAERIDPAVLIRFADLLAPFGFDRRALLPAYGLAEATLAVSGSSLRDEVTAAPVASGALALGAPVAPAGDSTEGDDVQLVVGCGTTLPGLAVDIVDDGGRAVQEGHLGQIILRGSSVATGYVDGDAAGSPTGWRDGVLYTGDAGFLLAGQLFVIGRLGDSMKIRGRTLFAEDVEAALAVAGVPRARLAVLLGATAPGATAVALIEQAEDHWLEVARAVLVRITEGATSLALDVPRGAILRTTSGKPKRQLMWRVFLAGDRGDAGADVPARLVGEPR